MPGYVIERNIAGAGDMTREDLCGASAKSCSVVEGIPNMTWIQSFVTGDRI